MARQRREEQVDQMNTTSSSEEGAEGDSSSSPGGIARGRRPRRPPRKKSCPNSTKKKGVTFALTSGVFAAFAGTFGKLAFTKAETNLLCEQIVSSGYLNFFKYSFHDAFVFCDMASLYIRILAFLTMILLNAFMWTTFVKALRYCSTSLEATVTNTAANFFSSAIVGQLLFDESVNLMWWCGTALIILGLVLMNKGNLSNKEGSSATNAATAAKTARERRKKYK